MKGRIFWSRKNSESSIEKIKEKLKNTQADKISI